MNVCPGGQEIPFPPIVGNGMVVTMTIHYSNKG